MSVLEPDWLVSCRSKRHKPWVSKVDSPCGNWLLVEVKGPVNSIALGLAKAVEVNTWGLIDAIVQESCIILSESEEGICAWVLDHVLLVDAQLPLLIELELD